jgi:hypothetical protein
LEIRNIETAIGWFEVLLFYLDQYRYDLDELFMHTPVFEGPPMDFNENLQNDESNWKRVSQVVLNPNKNTTLQRFIVWKKSNIHGGLEDLKDGKGVFPFWFEKVKIKHQKHTEVEEVGII